MRVISGSAKGTRLRPVPGGRTRPISDRVKQTLFDILTDHTPGSSVLDLFAGSGSVGIEALSRGASLAVFVEHHPPAVATIRANLQRAKLSTHARVVKADVFRYLAGHPQPYDLIYIAPPQYLGLWAKTLRILDANPGWLTSEGLVVVQIFPKELKPVTVSSLHSTKQRRVGSTLLCFYELSSPSFASLPDTQS